MFYIDNDYKCHTSNPSGEYRTIEKDIFPGKCDAYIEGMMYIPPDERWESERGVMYNGEQHFPWTNIDALNDAQREYEQEKLADAENALAILLGGVT